MLEEKKLTTIEVIKVLLGSAHSILSCYEDDEEFTKEEIFAEVTKLLENLWSEYND